jgi:methionyl-tRNA formyltransferase
MEKELIVCPRVVFLSSGGFFGDIILKGLIESPNFEVVGIVQSRRVFKSDFGFLRGAWNFFYRCGPIYTVYIWSITTFAEWLGFVTGRGSISARARACRLPFFRTRNINDSKGLQFVRILHPHLLITAHFDQKLHPPLCDGPEFAAVNLHPSFLPFYKGLEPVIRAWFDADIPLGITLHRLSPEIDGGRILAIDSGEELFGQSVFSRTCELMQRGLKMLEANATDLLDLCSGYPQRDAGSYHSWPTNKEIWDFLAHQGVLIKTREILSWFRRKL